MFDVDLEAGPLERFGRRVSQEPPVVNVELGAGKAEILDLGVDQGLITKSGVWYSVGETRLGQGRGQACQWLVELP